MTDTPTTSKPDFPPVYGSLPDVTLTEACEAFERWVRHVRQYYRVDYSQQEGHPGWDLGVAAIGIKAMEPPISFLGSAKLPRILCNADVGTGKPSSCLRSDFLVGGLDAVGWEHMLSCLQETLEDARKEMKELSIQLGQVRGQLQQLMLTERDARDSGYWATE